MFSGDSSGTVIVWNTFENVEMKSKRRRSSSAGRTRTSKFSLIEFLHIPDKAEQYRQKGGALPNIETKRAFLLSFSADVQRWVISKTVKDPEIKVDILLEQIFTFTSHSSDFYVFYFIRAVGT